jgi:hypothetical protein
MKQLILKQEKGGYLKADDLMPGLISKLSIKATNIRVQAKTAHRITFTVSHKFSDNGKISIKMPELLTLGDINSKVKVIDKGGNIKAVSGTVISSNVIEIEEVFGKDGGLNMEIPLTLDFEILSSKN